MVYYKFHKYQALDVLLKLTMKFSPTIAIIGETQVGKSSFLRFVAEEVSKRKFKKTWDYKKFCCRNFKEFIDVVDNNNNEVIAIEEAGFQNSKNEWYSLENRLMDTTLQTQAYKRNVYIFCLPRALSLASDIRSTLNMIFWVVAKNEKKRKVLVYPQLLRKKFWSLDKKPFSQRFLNPIKKTYTLNEIKMLKEYTGWLETEYKTEIMEDIKNRYAGESQKLPFSMIKKMFWNQVINQEVFIQMLKEKSFSEKVINSLVKLKEKETAVEMIACFECGRIHEKGNCVLKPKIIKMVATPPPISYGT